MAELRDAFFPEAQLGEEKQPAPHYNLRSRHAELFGGRDGYILDAMRILGELALFVASERRRSADRT
jgi:hypothetical protein